MVTKSFGSDPHAAAQPLRLGDAKAGAACSPTPKEARDAAIIRYAPLVKYVMGRMAIGMPAGFDRGDIVSFGMIGLIQAVDRFDDNMGVKFQTYALSRIRGSIIDALRGLDHVPRSVRVKAKRLDAVEAGLSSQLDREATEAEVAGALDMTIQQLGVVRTNAGWVTVSLDQILEPGDHDGHSLSTAPSAAPGEDFGDRMQRAETFAALASAVSDLPERERVVVTLYYEAESTMKEIGRALLISESRVSQIHGRALRRLRLGLDLAGERAA